MCKNWACRSKIECRIDGIAFLSGMEISNIFEPYILKIPKKYRRNILVFSRKNRTML